MVMMMVCDCYCDYYTVNINYGFVIGKEKAAFLTNSKLFTVSHD